MAFIESSVPPLKVFVPRMALYDWDESVEWGFERGTLISAKALKGSCMLFQVLFENGVMFDKLPVHALYWQEVDKQTHDRYPFHYRQLWNCISPSFSVVELDYLGGAKVDVFMKNRQLARGEYLWTFQWIGSRNEGANLTLAEAPDEHKSGHFLQMEFGGFAIQPNNALRWYEPSFVTKPFPEKPDFKVNTHCWNCEQHERWASPDGDEYLYMANRKQNGTAIIAAN